MNIAVIHPNDPRPASDFPGAAEGFTQMSSIVNAIDAIKSVGGKIVVFGGTDPNTNLPLQYVENPISQKIFSANTEIEFRHAIWVWAGVSRSNNPYLRADGVLLDIWGAGLIRTFNGNFGLSNGATALLKVRDGIIIHYGVGQSTGRFYSFPFRAAYGGTVTLTGTTLLWRQEGGSTGMSNTPDTIFTGDGYFSASNCDFILQNDCRLLGVTGTSYPSPLEFFVADSNITSLHGPFENTTRNLFGSFGSIAISRNINFNTATVTNNANDKDGNDTNYEPNYVDVNNYRFNYQNQSLRDKAGSENRTKTSTGRQIAAMTDSAPTGSKATMFSGAETVKILNGKSLQSQFSISNPVNTTFDSNNFDIVYDKTLDSAPSIVTDTGTSFGAGSIVATVSVSRTESVSAAPNTSVVLDESGGNGKREFTLNGVAGKEIGGDVTVQTTIGQAKFTFISNGV